MSASESLTYPGLTLLYPPKLSELVRISNGTYPECSDFYDLLMLNEYVPDTSYGIVKRVVNL